MHTKSLRHIFLCVFYVGCMTHTVVGDCRRPPLDNPYGVIFIPDKDTYSNDTYELLELKCENKTTPEGPYYTYCNLESIWDINVASFRCLGQCSTSLFDEDIDVTSSSTWVSHNDAFVDEGTTVSLSCASPGQFNGVNSAYCENGTFGITTLPSCDVYCLEPNITEGLNYSPGPNINESNAVYYTDGSGVTFSCDEDRYEGLDCTTEECLVTCQDGVWSTPVFPTCQDIPTTVMTTIPISWTTYQAGCQPPPVYNRYGVIFIPDKETYSNNHELVEIGCVDGTTSSAPNHTYCLPDSSWMPDVSAFRCLGQCSSSSFDDDILVQIRSTSGPPRESIFDDGTSVYLTCAVEGQYIGDDYVFCSNGTFQKSIEPSCLVYCPEPIVGDGLHYTPSPNVNDSKPLYYTDGSVISFTCEGDGYTSLDCTTVQCDSTCQDGTWSPSVFPTCGGGDLTCESTSMTLIIDRALLDKDDDAGDVHFEDNSCVGYDHDSNHVAITTDYNQCGTTQQQTNESIVFSNIVTYYKPDPTKQSHEVITREHRLYIPVTCILERQQLLADSYLPRVGMVSFQEVGLGKFALSLERYENSSFSQRANDAMPVYLEEPLFFGVSMKVVTDLTLFIESCWATRNAYPLDHPNYYMIKDGCAKDETVGFHDDRGPLFKGFQVDAFTFIGDYQQVFVHCSILVCNNGDPDSRCSQGCQSKTRRSLHPSGSRSIPHTISNGPLRAAQTQKKIQDEGDGTAAQPVSLTMITAAASAGVIIVLLVIITVLTVRMRTRPEFKGYQGLPLELQEVK